MCLRMKTYSQGAERAQALEDSTAFPHGISGAHGQTSGRVRPLIVSCCHSSRLGLSLAAGHTSTALLDRWSPVLFVISTLGKQQNNRNVWAEEGRELLVQPLRFRWKSQMEGSETGFKVNSHSADIAASSPGPYFNNIPPLREDLKWTRK